MHPHTADVPANLKDPKDKEKPPQYTDDHPEYPKLLYNHKTRQTAAAKDKDDEQKKAKDGFVEDPFPAEDPNPLSADDVKQLEGLLHKVAVWLQSHAVPDEGNGKNAGKSEKPAPAPAKK